MVLFAQGGCFRAKSFYSGKIDVFGKKSCTRAKVVVFGQSGRIRAKWLYSCKSGFILENEFIIRAKVVVIWQKWW